MIKTIDWDGKRITKPGIYAKVPISVYHGQDICDGPSVSSSGLRKIFAESPAHFFDEWSGNKNRKESDEEKSHFVLGRAVHMLVLGEPFFAKLFAIQPAEYVDTAGVVKKWTYNADRCKAWRADRWAEGRSILSGDDVDNIKGMSRSLGAHPLIRAGVLNGLIERSIIWRDKTTGLWIKARPDSIPGDSTDYVDLKSTRSVHWHDLTRTIADYSYHAQGALIRAGAREVLGLNNITFTLVFVEKTRPWCVRVVTLKDSDLDRGEKQNRVAMDTVAKCIEANNWPGPGGMRDDAEYIELPTWAQTTIDDRIKYGI